MEVERGGDGCRRNMASRAIHLDLVASNGPSVTVSTAKMLFLTTAAFLHDLPTTLPQHLDPSADLQRQCC